MKLMKHKFQAGPLQSPGRKLSNKLFHTVTCFWQICKIKYSNYVWLRTLSLSTPTHFTLHQAACSNHGYFGDPDKRTLNLGLVRHYLWFAVTSLLSV